MFHLLHLLRMNLFDIYFVFYKHVFDTTSYVHVHYVIVLCIQHCVLGYR